VFITFSVCDLCSIVIMYIFECDHSWNHVCVVCTGVCVTELFVLCFQLNVVLWLIMAAAAMFFLLLLDIFIRCIGEVVKKYQQNSLYFAVLQQNCA